MITQSAKDNLLTSLLFQNIALQYLEFTKHEVNGKGKAFLNQLSNRIKANERDCFAKITTREGREVFHKELSKGDALQYANIVLTLMEFDQEKRDLVERLVMAIQKGEMIEYVSPEISASL